MSRWNTPILCTCLLGCPIAELDEADASTEGMTGDELGSDGESDALETGESSDTSETAEPCRLFVDIDAPPGGDGSSWASARNDLRAAVEAWTPTCEGGEVWVAEGVYEPPDADVVLRVRPSVAIYGGFAGSERSLDERDVTTHPTILQQAHPGPAVVEIVEVDALADQVVLDGFVVRGDPSVPVESRGMGIVVESSVDADNWTQVVLQRVIVEGTSRALHIPGYGGVELRDAILRDNATTGKGAAVYQYNARLLVFDTLIADNHSQAGAAIEHYVDFEFSYFASIQLWNSELIGNQGGAIDGARVLLDGCRVADNPGGRSLRASLWIELRDVEIVGNGGGVSATEHCDAERLRYVDNAGPLSSFDLEVRDSLFASNVGTSGGAITASTSELGPSAKVRVYDSIFADNQAQRGGAIYAHAYWSLGNVAADVAVSNCEFVGNQATAGGALFGPIEAQASSFHANVATSGSALAGPDPQVVEFEGEFVFPGRLVGCALWPDDVDAHSGHAIERSCIPAGLSGFVDAGGNATLAADPFVTSDLDLDGHAERYLDPSSPCVDIGASFMGFDPSTRTTQTSQCSDAGPADAGVHHVPLDTVGPCP